MVSICLPLVCFIFGYASLDGVCKKKEAGRDEPEEEEGMERVREICVCVTASGETSRPDARPALSAAVVQIL